jgi:hypothetical protein
MNNFNLNLLFNDLEETDDYSDVDTLFSQLETIKPPVDMVERVMNAVSRLPLPVVVNDGDGELPTAI